MCQVWGSEWQELDWLHEVWGWEELVLDWEEEQLLDCLHQVWEEQEPSELLVYQSVDDV